MCGLGKTNVRLSIWTQFSSTTAISNPSSFNHYASSANEPNWLKSIVKFSFQKVIFGEVFWGWYQRWSPRGLPCPWGRFRGHILKSLALVSKVKSLALALTSKPLNLENCLVLGSRTVLFFVLLKSRWKTPETSRKTCEDLFCFRNWRSPENFFVVIINGQRCKRICYR